jgi:transcriptional regulator with XRE-family HTH domain
MQHIAILCKRRGKLFRGTGTIGPPKRRDREWFHKRAQIPANGTYLQRMAATQRAASDELRRARFGRFVVRVLEAAKTRGMTIKQIEEATDVGKSTFYRWRDGENLPKTEELRRFCRALGVPIAEAYAALGWSEDETSRPASPAPLIEDPDVRALMRKLNDPKVSAAEKAVFRRMMRAWAGTLDEEDQQ